MFFNKHWIYAVWQHSAFFPACTFLLDVSTLVTGDVNVKDMVYILLIPGIEVLYPLTRDVNTGVVVAPKFSDTLTLSQSRGGGNSAHRIGWVVPKKKHVVTYLETANFLKALILLCRPDQLSWIWNLYPGPEGYPCRPLWRWTIFHGQRCGWSLKGCFS